MLKESTLMRAFDRFSIKVVGIAGLCGAAIALSPDAAAAPPIKTGGAYACVQGMSGEGAAPAAEGRRPPVRPQPPAQREPLVDR